MGVRRRRLGRQRRRQIGLVRQHTLDGTPRRRARLRGLGQFREQRALGGRQQQAVAGVERTDLRDCRVHLGAHARLVLAGNEQR